MRLDRGHKLGPYEIVAPIGAGGMGEVYRARDTRLDRSVAIKLLPEHLRSDSQARERFEAEARAVSRLNHPHICTLYDLGRQDGIDFLIMEFLEGETLESRLRKGPLPPHQALHHAIEIADALAAAHRQAVIHRDLKPGNIMLTKSGAKLLDFGLAKAKVARSADDQHTLSLTLTTEGTILGTMRYMAPEQLEGKEVDARADIFAFGAVFYEMLTGRKAFAAPNQAGLIAEVLRADPPPLTEPGLAPFANITRKCMAKDRDERWESASDLKQVLEWIPGAAAMPSKTDQPSRTWLRAAALILAAILALSGVAAWLLYRADFFWRNPLANARFTRLTDFEGTERDADISADGKFVVFLSDREGTFDAWVHQLGTGEFVNLTKGRMPDLLIEDFRNVKFSGDGAQVWMRHPLHAGGKVVAASVWQIPAMGGIPRPFLEKGVYAESSPDRTRIVYHGFTGGDPIFIADRNGANAEQIVSGKAGEHRHFTIWSPDARYIYFVKGIPPGGQWDIWRVRSSGGEPERITYHRSRVGYPTLLDNRTLIYTAVGDDGSGSGLYSMDVERRIAHRVSSGVEQYISVAAGRGPEGRPRLVASVANPSGNLWTVALSDRIVDESAAARAPVPSVRAVSPRFGPGYIAYLSARGGADGLWKWSQGAALELWNGGEGAVIYAPAISPDGAQICFAVRKRGRTGLHLVSADGTNPRTLSESLDVQSAPSWSPDAHWIAVAADEGSGPRIFKVPQDGGTAVRLTEDNSSNPVWSPNGKFILYTGPDENGVFPLRAVTPDKRVHSVPQLQLQREGGERFCFLPNSQSIVIMQGEFWNRRQDFWLFDLSTGGLRQLTKLRPGFAVRSFDISPDGKQILFDRLRENSDLVLIDLTR